MILDKIFNKLKQLTPIENFYYNLKYYNQLSVHIQLANNLSKKNSHYKRKYFINEC
jgi:hypothetical protein